MAVVAERLREAHSPLDKQAAEIRRRFRAHGGLPHAEVEAVARRLEDRLKQAFEAQFSGLDLGEDASSAIKARLGRADCTFNAQPYHTLQHGGLFIFRINSQVPIGVAVETTPVVGISNDHASPFAFIVVDANRPATAPLKLRVTDLHPSFKVAAEARIEGWVKRTLSTVLVELQRAIDRGLGDQADSGLQST